MNRNLIHQLQRLPIIFNEYCFSNQGLDLDLLTLVEWEYFCMHDAYTNILSAEHCGIFKCSAATAQGN